MSLTHQVLPSPSYYSFGATIISLERLWPSIPKVFFRARLRLSGSSEHWQSISFRIFPFTQGLLLHEKIPAYAKVVKAVKIRIFKLINFKTDIIII